MAMVMEDQDVPGRSMDNMKEAKPGCPMVNANQNRLGSSMVTKPGYAPRTNMVKTK